VRLILDKALLPEFGDAPLDKITRDDVKTFAYRMLEGGRVREKKLTCGSKSKALSRSSVMGMGRTLSAIFNHAIEDGILTSNPAQRPGRYIRTGDRRDAIDILTPEEGRILLETAKGHHPRHYPILAAALNTGARQGELLALQWGGYRLAREIHRDSPGKLERDHFHSEERQGTACGPSRPLGGDTDGTPAHPRS
jgi:integrase